jgi:hypothetical protein
MAGVAGFGFGVAGSFGQAATVGSAPVGLILAVVGAGCLIVGARAASGSRAVGLSAALGVLAATGVLSMPSPGGSVVFPVADQVRVLIWVAAPVIVALVMLVWPRRRPPAQTRGGM